jgi:hypothetical protein
LLWESSEQGTNGKTEGIALRLFPEWTLNNSPAEPFASEEGVPNTRARVLDGGSAINAGFYSRAHPSYFFLALSPGALTQRIDEEGTHPII